jgi:hypothetical protein
VVDEVAQGNVTDEFTVPGPLSAAICQFGIPFVNDRKSELEHDPNVVVGAVMRAAVGAVYVVSVTAGFCPA